MKYPKGLIYTFPAVAILVFIAQENYLLFHSLAELFSIVIAFGIFVIGWNSRSYFKNNYLLFIGIAYLFVAFFDTLHTLAYKGMGVFKGFDDNNLPPQLWLVARYLESISLLIAPFFFKLKLRYKPLILSLSVISLTALYSIFYARIFPTCFVSGSGLTPFKRVSEYVIDIILLFALLFLYKRKEHFDAGVLQLLTLSIVCTMATELCFTVYVHLYGISNLVGHFFKIFAFIFMYMAIIETALKKPYNLLFKELQDRSDKLESREKQYRSLFNGMTEGFALHEIICDDQGIPVDYRFLDINPAFERLTGLTREKVIDKCVTEIIPGEDPEWVRRYGAVALTGTPDHFENYSPALQKHFEVFAYQTEMNQFAVLFIDDTIRKNLENNLQEIISKQKISEDALIFAKNRLLEAQHLAHIGNWGLDLPSGQLYWSDEIYNIFEIDPEHFGASYAAFLNAIHPDDRAMVNDAYTKSLVTRSQYTIKHRLLMPDGRIKHVIEQCNSDFDDQGKALRSSGTVQDITELENSRLAAEEANNIKSRFLANMSHEIRTPMNGILGMARLLQNSPLTKMQKEQADVIMMSANNLMLQLNDILDYSRLEAEHIDLLYTPFSLKNSVLEVFKIFHPQILDKGLNVCVSADDDVPENITGDPMKVRQILVNLISNAVKFTNRGAVTVVISLLEDLGQTILLDVAVTDTGIGIPEEMLDSVFQPFVQADSSISRQFGGTGLGLSISRKLARLMGGNIHAENRPEGGCCFHFNLICPATSSNPN